MIEYTDGEFEKQYQVILKRVVSKYSCCAEGKAIILCGQPGSGKSYFADYNYLRTHYHIDGDSYRRFHPGFEEIMREHPAQMPELTQTFTNSVVERLIDDLAKRQINIVVEGTLRDPQVPIKTYNNLLEKGYSVSVDFIAVDAKTSWKATLQRAAQLYELGKEVRIVPHKKYNYIVGNIEKNVDFIERTTDMPLRVITRTGDQLFPSSTFLSAKEAVGKTLQLAEWEKVFPLVQRQMSNLNLEDLAQTIEEFDLIK